MNTQNTQAAAETKIERIARLAAAVDDFHRKDHERLQAAVAVSRKLFNSFANEFTESGGRASFEVWSFLEIAANRTPDEFRELIGEARGVCDLLMQFIDDNN